MLKTGPAAGIFWMCMATLISSISGGLVRELNGQIPVFELVFFRNLIALVVLVPIVMRQGVGLPDRFTRRTKLPTFTMVPLSVPWPEGSWESGRSPPSAAKPLL